MDVYNQFRVSQLDGYCNKNDKLLVTFDFYVMITRIKRNVIYGIKMVNKVSLGIRKNKKLSTNAYTKIKQTNIYTKN